MKQMFVCYNIRTVFSLKKGSDHDGRRRRIMTDHSGHRSRKRRQFRDHGIDAFADHEVL